MSYPASVYMNGVLNNIQIKNIKSEYSRTKLMDQINFHFIGEVLTQSRPATS